MTDQQRKKITQYDYRPGFPVLFLFWLYYLFMPTYPGATLPDLELHQQIIALSSLPTLLGCMYWFVKVNYDI